jgi:hypothetical protein
VGGKASAVGFMRLHAMLMLLGRQVCSADDVKNGVMRRVFLGYTKDTCELAKTVSQTSAASAMVNGVVCCTTDGCNGPIEPTPAPVATQYVVRLVLSLSLTRAQFNATAQLRFREQMAVAAGLGRGDAGRVDLVINDAARRLLAGLAINVSISMDNATAANAAAAGLTETAINKALSAVGLPQVRTGTQPLRIDNCFNSLFLA